MRVLLPLVLPLLLPLAGCVAGAPPAAVPARPSDAPLPVDPRLVQGVLPNGLRYYVRANREPPARAELRLVVRAGSVLEDEDQRGLAHFVEHMAFNGTTGYARQELVDYLERVGMRFGPDLNAYTSFDETVYMLTVPTDSAGLLESGLRILGEWASEVAFDSTEVEKERGVVLEEWRSGQGAGARLQEIQFPVLVGGSPYAERLPIGTPESLRGFDQEALRRYYRDWYRPDLMAVVAVGDFDPALVESLIRERFGAMEAPADPRPRLYPGVPSHPETRVSVATDPEATASTVTLHLKSEPATWTDVGAYRRWLVETLASGMLTDRIGERIQRPGSPFLGVGSYQGRFLHPLAVYSLTVRVPDDGVARGVEELLVEIERAERHGFTDTELERAKSASLRRVEQRYLERDRATSAGFAAEYAAGFAYGAVSLDIETEFRIHTRLLEEITLAEVDAVARTWMGAGDRVVLVTAPPAAAGALPDEAALREVIGGVAGRDLLAYTDSVSDAPLLPTLPEPGAVVAERSIDAVGVTELRLSNGVRLLLKPTDYRPDEVLLVGRSPGGTSLVPDEDFLAARTAAAVVQAGGLGELSVTELTKRLAGTVAGVGADIGEQAEIVSGGGSPRDLETIFQLVHLKFTAPRMDSAAIEAYRRQAHSALANRSASPEEHLRDTLRAVLSQDHPRARPLTSADFDRLDAERSFEIYRDRFADASDFTFYLVGSFDPAEARALAARYLGSLPALGRVERGRDLGIRPPSGVVRRTVRRGIEPKALTQIVFTGEAEFSREGIYELNVLAEVLRLRLREALREDRGGTYGVQVSAGATRDPVPRYQLALGFGSDPDRLDELTAAAFAEMERLRREGPTAAELAKVREAEVRARETDLRSNQFWLAQLMSYDRQRWDMSGILEYPRWLASLDAATIQAAAGRYLDPENHIQASLVPETAGTARR